ncbi:nucleotidyltransferase domain-containing protein [bacterium]|nr:nucleotidyltransferase domain-containing protein [bacterium]
MSVRQGNVCHSAQKIADEIISALRAVTSVEAVALFGSLAEGRTDMWSDVDMWVACRDVETTQWTAAAAIHEAKLVLYYRPFTLVRQPSGRYWFVDESPFQKLDISFHSREDYAALHQKAGERGDRSLELYHAQNAGMPDVAHVKMCPLAISGMEQEVGNYIYQSLRSLKHCFRGIEDDRGFDGLNAAAQKLSRDTVMAGGRIGELVHKVAEMVRNCICLTPDIHHPTGGVYEAIDLNHP